MSPRRNPARPQTHLSESEFQARVIVCARMNGWRVDVADAYEPLSGTSRLHKALRYYLGKIPMKKLLAFLMGRRGQVFTLAYHTHDSRYSQQGYPDLTLVHPHGGRVIWAELKKCGGYPSLEQRIWLAALTTATYDMEGADVFLWSPDDWPQIVAKLGGHDPGLYSAAKKRELRALEITV